MVKAEIENSLISEGTVIDHARIGNSIIRRDVVVESGAIIDESIVMDSTVVGKNCKLKRVIIDKFNFIPDGTEIGSDPERDRRVGVFLNSAGGISVIHKPQCETTELCPHEPGTTI